MARSKKTQRARGNHVHRTARRATVNQRVARRVRHASKPKIVEIDASDVHPPHFH